MILGLAYGLIERTLDLEMLRAPTLFMWLDDLVVFFLPIALGALAGITFNYVRQQARLSRALSTENTRLQREAFAQLLSSHLLHEIRNPLHNLAAAIERWRQQLPQEQATLLERNIQRLEAVTNQLTHWNTLTDDLDVREPVALKVWLEDFIHDKTRSQLDEAQIHFEQHVPELTVLIHPLLLDQCFVTLFNNALEAAGAGTTPKRIRLVAQSNPPDTVEIRLSNSGSVFPEEVLANQGMKPVESDHRIGLGLVLVRRTLEQAGGSMRLSNDHGHATVILRLPGRPR